MVKGCCYQLMSAKAFLSLEESEGKDLDPRGAGDTLGTPLTCPGATQLFCVCLLMTCRCFSRSPADSTGTVPTSIPVTKEALNKHLTLYVMELMFSCLSLRNPMLGVKCWVKGKMAVMRKLAILGKKCPKESSPLC